MKLMRAAVLLGILVSVPLAPLAQEIQIIPLEDLDDEPGLTLQQLEEDGITLETFVEEELGTGPLEVLTDEDFQTFEQETQISQAAAGSLRVLDKLIGQVTDVQLDAGQSETVGRITVSLQECRYQTESPTSNAFVRITVVDNSDVELFAGWMVASSPALNALDHPRYDVWAVRCLSSAEPVEAGDVVSELDDPLAAAEEAERPQGAVETSLRPRPRP